MPTSATEKLKAIIHSLENISEDERALIYAEIKKIDKKLIRYEFQIKRVLKDKSIVVNILNATIEDLEKSKQKLEESNHLLIKQASELIEQKKIIEQKTNELEDHIRKLKFSYNELEQFSYIASHDLKSPLRTISSFAQLLQRRYQHKLDKEADEFIEFIVKGVQQMSHVIAALLEYSQVGDPDEHFIQTDLNEIMDLVTTKLRPKINANKAQIIYDELPTLCVHRTGITQLFQNLIDNSLKFRSSVSPIIHIQYQKTEAKYLFEFSDNGIGLNEDYNHKIFTPFQRLNNSQKGIGMGLAICKKVVKMHRGDISYSSSLNKGTTFSFYIRPDLHPLDLAKTVI